MSNLSSKNSKKETVSKYFKDKKQDNDESVSEFQEPKNSNKGPKTAIKARQASTASKTKKQTKKIKGQKDIRAALNKKNELVKYAKEFDQVCKISGIDVDPEQLQLAIALSKSLQATNAEESFSQKSKLLSAEERSGKIRTTLQEYGFKVPELKLQTAGRKRLKGKRKHSKLLLISEAERQQIITDKYSQLVLENTTIVDESSGVTDLLYKTVPLYHIATNAFYSSIKHDETFYVDGLLEKSPNTIGSLLRDWSKIPGRPLSPVLQLNTKVKCCELDFDGLEINDILSGTIEKVQDIIKRKTGLLKFHSDMDEKESTVNNGSPIKTTPNDKYNTLSITSPQYRCVSPDLFDDEDSEMLSQKSTKSENIDLSPHCSQISSNMTRKKSNDFMDLTECINHSNSKVVFPKVVVVEDCDQIGMPKLQTKCSNISQRKSNDFMEITNCIATCGQLKPIYIDNIDLTQGSDNETGDDTIIVEDIDRTFKKHDKIENFDLTQSSNSNDTLPIVHISETTRPVVEEVISPINSIVVLPKKTMNPIKEKSIFEEYIFEHSDHSSKNNQSKSTDTSLEANFTGTGEDTNVDLTQSSDSLDKMPVDDEFVVIPNDNILGKKDDISIDYDEVINDNNRTEETIESMNSLTNNIKCYDVYDQNNTICDDLQHHSLVKQINHDDFPTYHSDVTANNIDQGEDSVKTNDGNKPPISDTASEVFEISDEELNYSIHKSKHLTDNSKESNEVSFEIPKGNFECGGLSILDNVSGRVSGNINIERYSIRKSVNDSLPMVEIKGTKVKIKSPNKIMATDISTPVKDLVKDKFSFVNTPNNSEYVIKTHQVTPMVDYASLSTPERNKELDKYGLKPFKRKRAIQLLTHLYNQTHPVLETCTSEDLPSPSKKLKPNTENNVQKSSNETVHHSQTVTKGKSPRKRSSKSPRKASNIDDPYSEGDTAKSTSQKSKASVNSLKENVSQKSDKMLTNADNEKENISYEETSCVPVVKDLECSPDEWVFQKKEKAKIPSCRVPLHIAFHNYVSSRRGVREAILRYEPVNIDAIHKDLIGYGHRYDPKDLLRFLDKKCITVKTADNNARNKNK